jgi:hypothetical protein
MIFLGIIGLLTLVHVFNVLTVRVYLKFLEEYKSRNNIDDDNGDEDFKEYWEKTKAAQGKENTEDVPVFEEIAVTGTHASIITSLMFSTNGKR